MIPTGSTIGTDMLEDSQETSRTYWLDLIDKRIVGSIDGLEATKQAVFKILQSERFEHYIYSFNYGSEMTDLMGLSSSVIKSELARRIREALLTDDRITDVTDMKIEVSGDSALATFTVVSDFGSFTSGVTNHV
ncbi:phage protein [Paenibacillus baekrokdamisoli]|uniref:Phage protein n=1 Tax=Paenibacillus baekrokdamisoli TaxID=1712516 RepID=A0A3G9INE9_9BACL|nr:DUF2634 domain-containing protein [Paenibacillus baekrokdamisoli]MBB3070486.1 hypothetical protein [Paenibacillus baekrokdamisoli]BBH19836.1 phage protein [Paenibacillus baekrokdamisoli]